MQLATSTTYLFATKLFWSLNGEKSELKLYISPNLFKYATLLKHTVKNKICFVQRNVKLFHNIRLKFKSYFVKKLLFAIKKINFLLDYSQLSIFILHKFMIYAFHTFFLANILNFNFDYCYSFKRIYLYSFSNFLKFFKIKKTYSFNQN